MPTEMKKPPYLNEHEREVLVELIAITYRDPADVARCTAGFELLSLTRMRESVGWSQERCANICRVERPTWSAWESGKKRPNAIRLRGFFQHVSEIHDAAERQYP